MGPGINSYACQLVKFIADERYTFEGDYSTYYKHNVSNRELRVKLIDNQLIITIELPMTLNGATKRILHYFQL